MERRISPDVVDDYARVLRLDALLAAHEQPETECPVCGGELVAAESRNGDPFYWRCLVSDCYTRSLDRPARATGCCRARAAADPSSFDRCRQGRTGAALQILVTANASSPRT